MYRILAINPGSTSTKIAVYDDDQPILTTSLGHKPEDLARFATVPDQFEWRKDLIEETLAKHDILITIANYTLVVGHLLQHRATKHNISSTKRLIGTASTRLHIMIALLILLVSETQTLKIEFLLTVAAFHNNTTTHCTTT